MVFFPPKIVSVTKFHSLIGRCRFQCQKFDLVVSFVSEIFIHDLLLLNQNVIKIRALLALEDPLMIDEYISLHLARPTR